MHSQTPPCPQLRPGAQAGPAPHWHVPLAEQLSAPTPQLTHAAPPVPHVNHAGALHVGPEQQPLAHVLAVHPLQMPPEQLWPPGQLWHDAPAAPHALFESPERHVPPMNPVQQPEHERKSQTHRPLSHLSPPEQAVPVPHRQAPLAEQLFAKLGSQATHAAPPVAQVDDDGGLHVAPEQQPLAHVLELHGFVVQAPAAQTCPPPQAWQAAPPAPHDETVVPERHVPPTAPAQQPEQDVESHTQTPPAQRWPAEQGAPPPHWQAPLAEQFSAKLGSQATHAAPPVPQLDNDGVLQVEPEQHPLAHVLALHALAVQAPAAQIWPPPQAWQVAPPAPQDETLVPGTHVPPLVQQPEQDVESHTQTPPAQRWPVGQAAAVPHWQAPLTAEQLSASVGSQALQAAPAVPQVVNDGALQVAPEQQPSRQVVALHPLQAPPAQVWPPGHAWHAAPAEPQSPSLVPGKHADPVQQPGQLVESHTQEPARHRWPATSHWDVQLPQWAGSVCRSTHDPAQSVRGLPQIATHVLFSQLGVGAEQRTPQPPQLFGSTRVSTHPPLQTTWAPGHGASIDS